MAHSIYQHILHAAETLPRDEQALLLQQLAKQAASAEPRTRITDLCGLGQETWDGIDAQEYVNRERASWNG